MLSAKVLLILVQFYLPTGAMQPNIFVFDTMKECQEARVELLATKKSIPGVYYVLTCEKSKPTFTVEG